MMCWQKKENLVILSKFLKDASSIVSSLMFCQQLQNKLPRAFSTPVALHCVITILQSNFFTLDNPRMFYILLKLLRIVNNRWTGLWAIFSL